MRLLATFVVAVTFLITTIPEGLTEPGQYGNYGFSSIAPGDSATCGDWIKGSEAQKAGLQVWAVGFINGMAAGDAQISKGRVDILRTQNWNSVIASIDDVCNFNPRNTVVSAIRTVVELLVRQELGPKR